jgi:tubulin-folding cofactor B
MAANIKNTDLLALKSYITAADSTQYNAVSSSTLILDLTHSNLHQRHAEIRFDKHDTIDELRRRIHQKSGTPPCSQHLQLKSSGVTIYEIAPETESGRMLGYFNLPHGANVHCIDIDPHSKSAGGAYEDTSLVEKFTLTDEEYNKRKGTLRDWSRKQKENDPEFSLRKHAREHAELVEAKRLYRESGEVKNGFELDEATGVIVRSEVDEEVEKEKVNVAESEFGEETIQHLSLGARCQVQPGGRRGEIAYLGPIEELGGGGYWVGVILDEPVGKTDGTVKSGVRYFEAPGANRGGFFRGKNVEAGDFPEIDIMDSEDEL